jgi:peroxiredoxin Q/BCP
MLPKGSIAPSFEGIDQHSKRHTLEELLSGGQHVVLYFYPRDFTRVCTIEACIFRDSERELADLKARVVGVSTDSAETHLKFAERHRVNFPLLADENGAIAKAYHADRWFFGLTKRMTYVIAPTREIIAVFHHELSAAKHLEDVRRVLSEHR